MRQDRWAPRCKPPPPRRLTVPFAAPALAAGLLGVACATAQPVALRLQLRPVAALAQPAALDSLAAQVTQAAGVPADGVAAAQPGWFAVTLHCPDAARCDQAAARLAARSDLFSDVRPDPRRALPNVPSRETSR